MKNKYIAILFFTICGIAARAQDVGIGIAVPNDLFHVYGTDATMGILFNNVTTGTAGSNGLNITIDASKNVLFNQQESAEMQFLTSGTSRLRIDAAGHVGINTAPNAGEQLLVIGNSSAGTIVSVNSSVNAAGFIGVGNTGSSILPGATGFGVMGTVGPGNGNVGIAGFLGTAVNIPATAGAGIFGSSNGSATGYGVYGIASGATTNTAALFTASGGTNNYALIVPSGGGSVGIGTSSPSKPLDVNGTINSGKASGNNGAIQLTTSNASGNTVTLQSGVTSASYAITLPTVQGGSNQVMVNNGSGTLGWVTPTAAITGNSYFAYGTATNVINNSAGNGVFGTLSGLSVTITLTGTAVVLIHTDGGIATTATTSSGFSTIDVVLLNNGSLFTNGGYERVSVVNNSGVINALGFWTKDEMVSLAAGTYTFAVAASRFAGSNANISGNNTTATQGVLAVTVYYQ